MKVSFALSALLTSSLVSAASYNLVIAESEYKHLEGRNIVAKDGGFSVTNTGTPANFKDGRGSLKANGQKVFVDAKGCVGYGKAPKGALTSGWNKDDKELHWTKGAIFACPNFSFNIGTPTSYGLFANHEGTVTGQADDCFSIHLAVKAKSKSKSS
ncbi:hypothetical protein LCI18_000331 [Fusarium solani-melongenae]|uniref:Uncharacterized protein n=1 Tax=Fusarium solani subsp. cucurbitae TaxID=2747967 RepID=A0ACD3YKG2_FUSSC|nr:hypothetical protein LCI18_000331 [Fusarium solani-melongenae]